MKIGIYNIFTSFWFILMFSCGGTLTYISIDKNLFSSDLIFVAKFFIGLIVIITMGLLFYFLFKFRILIISNNKVISFYPFLFKIEKINLKDIKNLKLLNFHAFKGIVYKKIKITDSNGKLEISDLEFENFENLISELKINQNRKREIYFKQAKSNLSDVNFNIYLLSVLLLFIIFNVLINSGFHPLIIMFFIFNIVLLYASVKRKLEYKRIIKA